MWIYGNILSQHRGRSLYFKKDAWWFCSIRISLLFVTQMLQIIDFNLNFCVIHTYYGDQIKKDEMRGACSVEKYEVLFGKPQEIRRGVKHRWEDDIRKVVKETWREVVGWLRVRSSPVRFGPQSITLCEGSINDGESLNQSHDYQSVIWFR